MARFCFSKKAVEDLSQIWDYTVNIWSDNQADVYYNLIIETCREIAVNPKLGKDYSIVSEHMYGIRTGRHIIFYRILETSDIEIIRILHEQMDLKNLFR
ncbi:MAG: type II toxin-antitoxin system RelE/ParE family toxin [Bacteroidetes bacterium HGW-Bacteroidetes-10]|jgi:toxin ParE1/3/4|nr:MAG: type II toxin-antitoxin system RelE/ParE family toxin [Bacteroidetes bacterium HGW-Bacteroidetes-10]